MKASKEAAIKSHPQIWFSVAPSCLVKFFSLLQKSHLTFWLLWSFPELLYIWDSRRIVLEIWLWGIRQAFVCQGMTHNNALKIHWIKTGRSGIDSIFLVWVRFSNSTLILKINPPPYQKNDFMWQCMVIGCVTNCGLLVWKILSNILLLPIIGSISEPSTAGAGRTTTTQTSTTSTRGTPNSTKRQSVSMANTQQRSNKTWRGARLCSESTLLTCSLLQFELYVQVFGAWRHSTWCIPWVFLFLLNPRRLRRTAELQTIPVKCHIWIFLSTKIIKIMLFFYFSHLLF